MKVDLDKKTATVTFDDGKGFSREAAKKALAKTEFKVTTFGTN